MLLQIRPTTVYRLLQTSSDRMHLSQGNGIGIEMGTTVMAFIRVARRPTLRNRTILPRCLHLAFRVTHLSILCHLAPKGRGNTVLPKRPFMNSRVDEKNSSPALCTTEVTNQPVHRLHWPITTVME